MNVGASRDRLLTEAPSRSATLPSIDVAVVTDGAFLPWCACTLLSGARATTNAVVNFHVLTGDDVSVADQDRLVAAAERGGATVRCRPVDEEAIGMLPTKGPALGGRMSWARVLLADVLDELDRVIYIDADTLVRESLLGLWDTLQGAPVAAVANVTEPAMRGHIESLGLLAATDYFNAGVLVIDLAAWRAERTRDELIRVATSRPLPWFDQDALNVVFAHRWSRLQPRWNAMNSLWAWADYASDIFAADELEEARTNPAVLHFEGPPIVKPWHFLSQHPFRHEYRDVLAETAWAERPLEGRTVVNRLIGLLPEHRWLDTYLGVRRQRAWARGTAMRLRRRLAASGSRS